MWSRIHLIPVLQAEEDRDLVRRHWAQEAREKELLGAETKVYNNDRCVHPKRDRDGAVEESCAWRKLTKESGSCVLRTRSLPARPRNRGWWVRKQGREREIADERARTCHVVNIAGILGRYSTRRQPPADAQYQMFIQM